MAAGILQEPGSEFGPCVDECAHRDCAETRKMAAAECVHCDEPIGYGVRFYHVDTVPVRTHPVGEKVYAHARCEEKIIVRQKAELGGAA